MSIIEEIKSIFEEKRDPMLSTKVTGRYRQNEYITTYLYNDDEKRYVGIQDMTSGKSWNVTTAENFAKLVDEELKRHGNTSGAGATVKLTLRGGSFCADDEFGAGCNEFIRSNSQQWLTLKAGINKTFGHEEFLQWFRGLKPSVERFEAYFRMFAKLRVIGLGELKSNPYFTDGQQESGYTVSYRLEGCTDDMTEFLPNSFTVTCPFEKANEKTYSQTIELLFANNGGDIEISVFAPDFEVVEKQAIQDEADLLKTRLKKHENLLILADFA